MFVLDTDTLSLLLRSHSRLTDRVSRSAIEVVVTEVTRMEQLQGRFHALFKAEDGERLLAARQRLLDTERDLARIQILPLDEAAAAEFERLLGTKGLRRIGRGDLLIVSIVLANKATLVTRNVKDFEKVPGLKMENWVD